ISSIGASKNAKRAAMVHLYFNLIGTIIFMVVFFGLNAFIHFAFLENAANPAGIAVVHSLFNIGATIILYPFTDKLVKLAEITIPDRKGDDAVVSDKVKKGVAIDERFLDRPAFAIAQCKSKAREMAEHTKRAISLSLEVLLSYDEDKANEVIKLEKLVDKYEDALGTYLVKLSSKTLSTADSHSMSIILHSISDYERISDHAMDIVKSAEEINSKGLAFTPHARQEIETLCRAVNDICNMTVECFCNDDIDKATHVEPLEEVIDTLTKRIKENHINRLRKGKCTIEMGFILEDILTGIERVSDHFSNIAVEMITIVGNDYNTHGYFKNFSSEERQSFDAEYDRLLEEYSIG
ncbi:MAG: Na/Pi cotransporter family protein, partial [Lachnospiraceae bacterium]|nr:Na/Pi cotransporter family protein [Lachnospiraceae bacterium]